MTTTTRKGVKDLAGRKFGKLTAIAFAGLKDDRYPLWSCKCDCGAEKVARQDSLLNGGTRSCGCLMRERRKDSSGNRLIDISGRKFGKLTAIKVDCFDGRGNAQWWCQCDCGNTITVDGSKLRYGQKRTCGCADSGRKPGQVSTKEFPGSESIDFSKPVFFDWLDLVSQRVPPDWFMSCARVLRGLRPKYAADLRTVEITGDSIDARNTREAIALFIASRSSN